MASQKLLKVIFPIGTENFLHVVASYLKVKILMYRMSQKKRTNKTNKNGQTWQACQHSKVVQGGTKGSKIVNLDVFDHLEPLWGNRLIFV